MGKFADHDEIVLSCRTFDGGSNGISRIGMHPLGQKILAAEKNFADLNKGTLLA